MSSLIRILNKFNGNICFAAKTEDGDVIFECDRLSQTVQQASSTKEISGVSLNDSGSYLVSFSDSWIGKFSNGVLNEEYIDTGLSRVDQIIKVSATTHYALDRLSGQLFRLEIE